MTSKKPKGAVGKHQGSADYGHLWQSEKKLNKNKGGTPRLETGRDVNKYIGDKINKKIEGHGKNLEKGGHKAVDKAAEWAKGKGGDAALINYAGKHAKKTASKLIRTGTGAAKRWIHTEGRNAINQGIHHIKEGAKSLGKRIRGGFEELGNRIKRRRT